jgi:hypothetical protein
VYTLKYLVDADPLIEIVTISSDGFAPNDSAEPLRDEIDPDPS